MSEKQKKKSIDKFIVKLSKKLSFCIKKSGDYAYVKLDKFSKWVAGIDRILAKVPLLNEKAQREIEKYYTTKLKLVKDLDNIYTEHEGRHTYGFNNLLDESIQVVKNMLLSICVYVKASESIKFFDETNRKVFVVHGRDETTLEKVNKFLREIGLDPVILKFEPKKGGFILQRFIEVASECNFAMVLLTPDDKGSLVGEENELKRARQNVIFELGYFISLFGVDRVLTLYNPDVDLPSDLLGRFYIEIKDGWGNEVVRELKAMGYKFEEKKENQGV